MDFDFIGNTRLASVEPDTDDSLSPHNNEVWGNIKIFYTVAVSHASLIGDDNVNVDHISSGSADDGQVITADGAGGSAWEDAASSGATDFAGLSDTPAALGTVGQVPAVNAAGDALEFIDAEGVTGTYAPEVLFDNHPTLVEIGTLNGNVTSLTTGITLAAAPTETVDVDDFLLVDSEVMDVTFVNGAAITVARGVRGTAVAVHLGSTPVYLLTATNGGLGRLLTTRSWVYGSSNQNAFDLGKALTQADDDGKECYIEVEYDGENARRYGETVIDAQTIRELRSLVRISTSTTHETFSLAMQRSDQTGLESNAVMLLHFGRKLFDDTDATNFGVTSGNDGLRLAVGVGGAASVLYRVYLRIRLIDPSGGAADDASGQVDAGGPGLVRIAPRALLSSDMALTEYGLNTAWGAVVQSTAIEFLGFPADEVDRFEIGFNVNASYQRIITITREHIEQMGTTQGITGNAGTTIPGMYFSGRTIATADSREPPQLNPKLGWMNNRRLAGRFGVLIQIRHSDEGELNAILPWVSANTEIDMEWAYMVPRGAAV